MGNRQLSNRFLLWRAMKNACSFIVMLLLFAACADRKQRQVNAAVSKAVQEFPGFRADKGLTHSFKLAKRVANAEEGFEIQLFVQHNDTEGTEKIIALVNPDGESFAIPFPSNGHKTYWEFPFEKQTADKHDGNSPFARKLVLALDKAASGQPNENALRNAMVNELFTSVLNCRNLEERDSTLVYRTISVNSHIQEESSDSAFARLRKNYEMMRKEWHPAKYATNYNCFLDPQNARIYQLQYAKNGTLSGVKTYRQDYGLRHYTY